MLLTSRTEGDAIVDHVRATGVRAVQIVSHVEPGVRRTVREALPGTAILQAVHVEGADALEIATAAAEDADAVLLDSGRPNATTPELGGTGRTHDWSVSREIVERLEVPVFLAGGLGPDNVAEAIRAVRPAGVDLCSGLRDEAFRLDPDHLAAFVETARTA